MDWLSFIATIVGSTIGPLAILVGIVLLRHPIIGILSGIRRVKVSSVELEFQEAVDAARSAVSTLPASEAQTTNERPDVELPAISPEVDTRGAVVTSWLQLEDALRKLAEVENLPADKFSASSLLNELRKREVLDPATAYAIDELRRGRNLAVHSRSEGLTTEQATDYVQTAKRIALHIASIVQRLI